MKNLLILGLLVVLAISLTGDDLKGCTGEENPFDLIDTEPTLVQTVANGKKYTIGNNLFKIRL